MRKVVLKETSCDVELDVVTCRRAQIVNMRTCRGRVDAQSCRVRRKTSHSAKIVKKSTCLGRVGAQNCLEKDVL